MNLNGTGVILGLSMTSEGIFLHGNRTARAVQIFNTSKRQCMRLYPDWKTSLKILF